MHAGLTETLDRMVQPCGCKSLLEAIFLFVKNGRILDCTGDTRF
jgi:hypothetical protein